MSDKTEHLNMIQNVITRMANHSLQIKCWAIAITTAFAALSSNWVVFFASAPIVLFWILDTYYLSMERRFRELYDEVRAKEESEIDFSMKTENYRTIVMNTASSWSVLPYYLVLILVAVIIGIVRIVV